jgi:hypothetical protein
MEVICIEEPAFYTLIEKVVARLKLGNSNEREEWLSPEAAMKLLNVKAKSTMQELRDKGKIRFSQPQKKIILYSRSSINEYLEANARNNF